jgi:hypothetical protein
MIKFPSKLILSILILFSFTLDAHSGFVTKGVKSASKVIAKKGITHSSKPLILKQLDDLTVKYGNSLPEKIDGLYIKKGYTKNKIIQDITSNENLYKKYGFSNEVLQFGLDNGKYGKSLIRKFDYSDLKNAGLLNPESKKSLKTIWRATDDYAIGKSKRHLYKTLNHEGININKFPSLNKYTSNSDRYSSLRFSRIKLPKDYSRKNRVNSRGKKPNTKKVTRTTKAEKEIYRNANVSRPRTVTVSGKKVKVRQKNDIDGNKKVVERRKGKDGKKRRDDRNNCQRMKDGNAPYANDGNKIELHHHKQENVLTEGKSYYVELSRKEHQENYKDLHSRRKNPKSPEEAKAHQEFVKEYWQERYKQICK